MRAAGRRPRGYLLPQGALSMRDAPPIFFLRHQKENAPRPVEKKKCSAGRSAPAQTSCRRRGMVGCPARRSGTETRCPWGDLWPGEVKDTSCADFRCRWPVVDESVSIGQRNATFSTPAGAARSEAERAERGAGQMRSCSPMPSVPSTAGISRQICTAPRRARRIVLANTQAPSHADSRTARRHEGAGARPKAFFSFGPCTARFLFGKTEKKMGGALPRWQSS